MDTTGTMSLEEQIEAAIAAKPKITTEQLRKELAEVIGIDNDADYQRLCQAVNTNEVYIDSLKDTLPPDLFDRLLDNLEPVSYTKVCVPEPVVRCKMENLFDNDGNIIANDDLLTQIRDAGALQVEFTADSPIPCSLFDLLYNT